MNIETRTFILGIIMLLFGFIALIGIRADIDSGNFNGFWDYTSAFCNILMMGYGLHKVTKTTL